MNKHLTILFFLAMFVSCKSEKKTILKKEINTEIVKTSDFELIKASEDSNTVLILFGGFGEKPEDIKREFKITNIAKKNNVSLLLMNYSSKLWLEEDDKKGLAYLLQETLENHNLQNKNIFIGGFSSGGIVSMLISNYINGKREFYIDPKGVFIADSPIDLLALYKASELNIKKNFSEVSVAESNWIIKMFNDKLGSPKNGISMYEKNAVYTMESDYTKNLDNLKNTKIRLYTEPDVAWWQENRRTGYEQTNAFYIKHLSESLQSKGFKDVAYIATQNKGYRANGERHPHSWSIIDKENLFRWMLE